MMKQAHSVTISVYSYEEEDEEKTAETLIAFLPEQFEEENIQLEITKAKVLEGRDMKLFSVTLTKQRHINYILKELKAVLGDAQCATIASQENRVDNEGNLYIRLDKTKLEETDEAVLTDGGTCYHFKIVLAAFPKNRENALNVAKELFS
ncbi:hypothetical protein K9M74_05410 [Candidatus Woesearchaeota archaeon]|nr:hypothetical protein [Candidatus Woesearchaeota archaeon]